MSPRGAVDALAVMAWSSARRSLRSPDALISAVALPVALLLLMAVVFGGAMEPDAGAYTDYVTPGVLALCAGFGASQVALSVALDARGGAIDRFRTMDIPAAAPILGHIAVAVARNLVAAALVLLTAFLLGAGLTREPLRLALLAAIVAAFTLAVGTLAAAVGLGASSPEAAAGLSFLMLFLPYVSSAFVPVDTLPGWLQGFAGMQPFTALSETIRAVLLDRPFPPHAAGLVLWTAGILAAAGLALGAAWRRLAR